MHSASPALTKLANNQHVGVIVSARSRSIRTNILESTYSCHNIPFVRDVASSAPLVSSCFRCPVPHIGSAITHTVNNVTVHLIQCLAHHDIGFLNSLLFRIFFYLQISAIVIFQIIHSPAFPCLGINFFVLVAAHMSATSDMSR